MLVLTSTKLWLWTPFRFNYSIKFVTWVILLKGLVSPAFDRCSTESNTIRTNTPRQQQLEEGENMQARYEWDISVALTPLKLSIELHKDAEFSTKNFKKRKTKMESSFFTPKEIDIWVVGTWERWPFETRRSMFLEIELWALERASASVSWSQTSTPLTTASWAIPEPIWPAPTTPMHLISAMSATLSTPLTIDELRLDSSQAYLIIDPLPPFPTIQTRNKCSTGFYPPNYLLPAQRQVLVVHGPARYSPGLSMVFQIGVDV